jgi:hypothetical protein
MKTFIITTHGHALDWLTYDDVKGILSQSLTPKSFEVTERRELHHTPRPEDDLLRDVQVANQHGYVVVFSRNDLGLRIVASKLSTPTHGFDTVEDFREWVAKLDVPDYAHPKYLKPSDVVWCRGMGERTLTRRMSDDTGWWMSNGTGLADRSYIAYGWKRVDR